MKDRPLLEVTEILECDYSDTLVGWGIHAFELINFLYSWGHKGRKEIDRALEHLSKETDIYFTVIETCKANNWDRLKSMASVGEKLEMKPLDAEALVDIVFTGTRESRREARGE